MSIMQPQTQEAQRIIEEYSRREREIPADFYALWRPANLFIWQGHERAVLRGLSRAGLLPLTTRRVLDVGCGKGDWLGVFEEFGCPRDSAAGIELGPAAAQEAATRFPGADVRCGNATQLPWEDRSFDVVFQRTIFSSILDHSVRRVVAAEMLRVLRPGGAIIWLEFFFNNPRNPHVVGIGSREVRALFPGCNIKLRRITLAPPLARRVVPLSWGLASWLESLRFLNTHHLGVIQREG